MVGEDTVDPRKREHVCEISIIFLNCIFVCRFYLSPKLLQTQTIPLPHICHCPRSLSNWSKTQNSLNENHQVSQTIVLNTTSNLSYCTISARVDIVQWPIHVFLLF